MPGKRSRACGGLAKGGEIVAAGGWKRPQGRLTYATWFLFGGADGAQPADVKRVPRPGHCGQQVGAGVITVQADWRFGRRVQGRDRILRLFRPALII